MDFADMIWIYTLDAFVKGVYGVAFWWMIYERPSMPIKLRKHFIDWVTFHQFFGDVYLLFLTIFVCLIFVVFTWMYLSWLKESHEKSYFVFVHYFSSVWDLLLIEFVIGYVKSLSMTRIGFEDLCFTRILLLSLQLHIANFMALSFHIIKHFILIILFMHFISEKLVEFHSEEHPFSASTVYVFELLIFPSIMDFFIFVFSGN